MVRVTINGETGDWEDGLTLDRLIARLNLEGVPIAVERNRAVVPRAEYGRVRLQEDDRIEIVHFVGGG